MSNDIPGTLTIAAVPIGCLDDASPRLAAALGRAQIIAAEDTRRLLRLASRLGVPLTARIVSYWDVTEQSRAAELAGELAGRAVTCCWSPTRACPRSATPGTAWSQRPRPRGRG